MKCATKQIRPSRRGLGLVEAMISLVIAATLLTAVSAAFNASAKALQINDEFFRSTQSARVSLARILSQVRTGQVDEASTANNLHLITTGGQDLTYKLVTESDPTKGPMRLVMVDNSTATTYELARNVTTTIATDSPFAIELGKDSNNADCVSRVSLSLSVKCGGNEVRLSGSAAPRRNLSY
jgi:Tfp pilus assembly protein PilW